MALTASVFSPLSCGVDRRNYSAGRNARKSVDRNAREIVEQRLASQTYSYKACAFDRSPSVLARNRRTSRLGIGGTLHCSQRRRESRLVLAAENSNSNQSGETGATSNEADVEALEARLGLGRRSRRQQQAGSDNTESKPAPEKPKAPKKTWDSMNLAEKAWTLYIDPEKGILFWLNKLAYGAIYTIIGAWIVFRFIGPALGWYELDQPLLTPDRLLDGGP